MVKVKFDLFDCPLWQIFQSFVGIAIVAIVGWHADDFVVYFSVVDKFHHAENPCFHPNTSSEWLVGDHQHV